MASIHTARAHLIAGRPAPNGDDNATPPKQLHEHLVYFEDLDEPVHPDDFVEGLLISRGMSVVYGQSNSGKTFFATDLALHVACGWPWNGRDTTRGAVLYCALEGSHGIKNRVSAFKQTHGLGVLPFAILPVTVDMLNPSGDIDGVLTAIKKIKEKTGLGVSMTVMDTLSRAMAGGNENAPDDMGALVQNGARLQQEGLTHVCWVHHSGKDEAKGARGHSLLRAATDTEIEITASGPTRTARVTKQRDLDCEGEFTFNLKVFKLGTNTRGKPITSCTVDYGDSAALGRGHAAGAASARRHLTGHNKRALEVLIDLCAVSGQAGHPGVPSGIQSVPEKWWRDRFYDRSAPGDSEDAKQKAFRRASVALINEHLVGMVNRRVWSVSYTNGTGHWSGQNTGQT
jgi:hypothetical protein